MGCPAAAVNAARGASQKVAQLAPIRRPRFPNWPSMSTGLDQGPMRPSKKMPAKQALKGVDLQVAAGFDLRPCWGPNGAGKSTFINILAGLVNKTSGSVNIWGIDADKRPREARAALGIVPQEINMDPFFTPRETLELMAGFYGVPTAERRTDEILDALGTGRTRSTPMCGSCRAAMKRRLMVAKALVHTPPILILDEPTAGVDVELRRSLWEYVRKLNARGTTIVLTTHYLEEAQEMCDQIAIINHGAVTACEPTPVLFATAELQDAGGPAGDRAGCCSAGIRRAGCDDPQGWPAGDHLQSRMRRRLNSLLAKLREANVKIGDLATEEPDLEDVFLALTSN